MITALTLAMALFVIVVLPLMAIAFLLGRHYSRRPAPLESLSAVTRQHIELFQGVPLNEAAVHATKERFRRLLEGGQVAAVEASLRPGTNFVFGVRALAEIGSDDAGLILERQLQRRLSGDPMEQSWYRIDLAHGLRALNREESLPHLLGCADEAAEAPLGHFFAAETVCFLGFGGYLQEPGQPLGRAALRVLARAVEGLRFGVRPILIAEARLGEVIETMWDHRPHRPDPLVARVAADVLRWNRRAPQARATLSDGHADLEAFDWQMARLSALEPALVDYLEDSARTFVTRLDQAGPSEVSDLLAALSALRAEAGDAVIKLLSRSGTVHAEPALEVLAWSRSPRVGPWLCDWAGRAVSPVRRAQRAQRRGRVPAARSAVPSGFPYGALLRALRNHPSAQAEAFLLLATRDRDPLYRAAAFSGLGWWQPFHPRELDACLNHGREDCSAEVRQAARAALARLGERCALGSIRQSLASENTATAHEAIQTIAAEGLTLLWPDLDRLADADDADIRLHAREALERLSEEMDWHGKHRPNA